MKKKSRIIATSIATVAMCASLIAGGTYALFTSESTVNVAVTSGTVSVVATVDEDSIEYGSTVGTYIADKPAFSTSTNTLTLGNMLPGDWVEFELTITNNSTVSAKYQTAVSVVEDTGLFEGLEVTIDDVAVAGVEEKASKWNEIAAGETIDNVSVRIELPDSHEGVATFGEDNLDNKYQGKICTLAYVVRAVQGNATTYDPIPTAKIRELTAEEKHAESSLLDGATFDIVAGRVYEIEAEELASITESQYADWSADFEISFNQTITYKFAKNSVGGFEDLIPLEADLFLIGNYGSYGWIPLPVVNPAMVGKVDGVTIDEGVNEDGVEGIDYYTVTLEANKPVRALGDIMGMDYTYSDIATDVGTFYCGIVLDGSALDIGDGVPPTGTEATIELKLYEQETGVVKTVDTYVQEIKKIVTVTPENISEISFDANATYNFVGDFTASSYTIKAAEGLEMILDGSAATFANAQNVKFSFGQIADGLNTVTENGEWIARTGNYTVQNFTVENGSISFGAKNTSMNVNKNTAKAMDIDGSNCTVNVVENTTVSDGAYVRYSENGDVMHEYAFYFMAVNYDLSLTGNDFTSETKDAVSIFGRGEWDMADYTQSDRNAAAYIAETEIENSIVLSGNKLTAERRALYIFGDHTYGCNHVFPQDGTASTEKLSPAAKALIKGLLTQTVTLNEDNEKSAFIGFGGLYLSRTQSEAIN